MECRRAALDSILGSMMQYRLTLHWRQVLNSMRPQQSRGGPDGILAKDTDITKTKGRARTRRYKSALEVHAKKFKPV